MSFRRMSALGSGGEVMSRVKSAARSRVALWTAGWVGLYIGFLTVAIVRLVVDERAQQEQGA